MDTPGSGPRRVLVLSAPVGEGHVAAARALAVRMRGLWPQAHVTEIERSGHGGGRRDRLLRLAWAGTMRLLPGAYGCAYDLLVRYPGAAEWFKGRLARRFGRALGPVVAAERPDLVVSTYPLISGGLAWLRRRGRLPAYAVALVTDVAVHPFWVWPELDETWTLLPTSRRQAQLIAPRADVRVVPAVCDRRFRPGDRAAARVATGLAPDAFVVLVTGGSLAFGRLDAVVDAVLTAGPDVHVVVLCGRDERLRTRLRTRGPADRLVACGWTERVPELMAAADVVVSTAGGMMATEALAAGRPVLFAAPVPGHGRAGAAMTAAAGLGVVCPRPSEVTATLRRLRVHPAELAALRRRAVEFGHADPEAALVELAARI